MQNQAMRRGGRNGGEVDDYASYANDPEGRHPNDLGLRPGQHYDPQGYEDYRAAPEEPQAYDPRAYAPNPDEAFEYDANGEPVYYDPHYRPARANRSGLVVVAAVVGVALLGGAGALGYRMMGQGGVLSGEPPLIKADAQPSKTVPEAAVAADNSHQNKQIYDRVGVNPAQKSKVVSREEEPVELPASAAPAANADSARVILPGGPAAVEPVAPTTMGSEPRRVKTVEIKPDSSYDAEPMPTRPAASDPIAQMAATGQAPGAASEFDNGIMSDGDASAAAASRARPAAPAPAAARPQPVPAAPVAQAPAPAPRSTPAPVAAPARPAPAPAQPRDQQVATAAVPRPATPAAPAPRASAGGGYVVQVTSQRSDADARSAYANLQRKFPQVLGGYSANIQTAVVGDRGTYYRVRVGPFADGAQASTVCGNLRAAGGDCVVSRN